MSIMINVTSAIHTILYNIERSSIKPKLYKANIFHQAHMSSELSILINEQRCLLFSTHATIYKNHCPMAGILSNCATIIDVSLLCICGEKMLYNG